MNCCNNFGECTQGRDCPVRVAKVGKRMHGPEPLKSVLWRYWVRRLALWLLLALVWLVGAALMLSLLG
jgi:hypothetical protein